MILRGFTKSNFPDMPACGAFAFRRWAYTFTLAMVAASGRLPQLSGFYHLICTAMQLAEAGGLLGGAQVRSIDDGFYETHHCHPPSILQQNSRAYAQW